MRIALIAPPWLPVPPRAYGGTEAVVDRLARGFAARGHDVVLFATRDSTCPVPVDGVYRRADPTTVGLGVRELRHVMHAYEVAKGYDVVHDHTVYGPIHAERFPGLPVVATVHGAFDEDATDIYRAAADRAALVAVSRHQASTAPGVRVCRVIHHGVDPERFPVGGGDGGYALFLGRMNEAKGVDTAIRVARLAGMPLKVAAKMREHGELHYFHRCVEPLLGDDVEYLGEVTADEKVRLLGAATALLNPIRWPEPFGLVMVEAMACGTPVVTTGAGAAPEIVADGVTGFVRDREDDLVTALLTAAALDRGACRASVEGYFSTDRMVEEYLELFEAQLG